MSVNSDERSAGKTLANSLDQVRSLGCRIKRACLTGDGLVLEGESGASFTVTEASIGNTDAGWIAAELISRLGLVSFKEVDCHIANATLLTVERLEDGSVTIFVVKPGE